MAVQKEVLGSFSNCEVLDVEPVLHNCHSSLLQVHTVNMQTE